MNDLKVNRLVIGSKKQFSKIVFCCLFFLLSSCQSKQESMSSVVQTINKNVYATGVGFSKNQY